MADFQLPDGLSFRVAQESDESFLYSSFIKSTHAHGTLLDRRISAPQSHELLRQVFQNVMRKAACVILCDENHQDSIVGFVVFERQQRKVCVHFVYVKEHARGIGYSNLLWNFCVRGLGRDDAVWISTLSARARNIMDAKKIAYQFRPAMLLSTNTFQQSSHQANSQYAKEEDSSTLRYLSLT